MKLNFDGSVKNGISKIGFIIRNHKGEILDMHNQTVHEKQIIQVEARALLEGVLRAEALGITKIIIEGDNLSVINAIKKTWKPPWEIRTIISDISTILERFTFVETYHCFREGNQAADFIAKSNCTPSLLNTDPLYRSFYVIIRKDELGWSFDRKST